MEQLPQNSRIITTNNLSLSYIIIAGSRSPEKFPRPSSQSMSKTIEIEICKNCRSHEWCTRHDEKKYTETFEDGQSQ